MQKKICPVQGKIKVEPQDDSKFGTTNSKRHTRGLCCYNYSKTMRRKIAIKHLEKLAKCKEGAASIIKVTLN
jgi:hypothetical protein